MFFGVRLFKRKDNVKCWYMDLKYDAENRQQLGSQYAILFKSHILFYILRYVTVFYTTKLP